MTSVTLMSTSCHSSGGWVGGGCGQVTKGSSWVEVELPPQLLAPPVDAAAPEAREASCLTLKVARQSGKIGSFTMFQWWGSATERGTVIWGASSSLGGNTCSCLGIQLHSILPWRWEKATCADGGSPPLRVISKSWKPLKTCGGQGALELVISLGVFTSRNRIGTPGRGII